MKKLSSKLHSIYQKNKNWLIRSIALVFTILCTLTLKEVGEPRRAYLMLIDGLTMSLILNAPLFLSSFKWVRIKGKYLTVSFIFLSSLGVFFTTPWGWTSAFVTFIIHILIIFDLLKTKEV